MKIEFTKMSGLGNMFIILNGPLELSGVRAREICDEFATDGLLVVRRLDDELVEMKYWNADGLAAEMCGNGLRCVTKFSVDNGLAQAGEFKVRTDAGTLKVVWDGKDQDEIEVQVGKFSLEGRVRLYSLDFYKANVGNPHAVTFVEDVDSAPVKKLGPKVETDKTFPHKTNVEFVQVENASKIKMRTWERGAGETKACGTGMVAAAAVAASLGKVKFPVDVKVLGGTAKIWLDDEDYLRLLGPVRVLSSGELEI